MAFYQHLILINKKEPNLSTRESGRLGLGGLRLQVVGLSAYFDGNW